MIWKGFQHRTTPVLKINHSLSYYTSLNQRVLNKLSKEHNISCHKWSITNRERKSHRSKISITYILSWKQCDLPVITTVALCQLMHVGTWYGCILLVPMNQRVLNKLSKKHDISCHKWSMTHRVLKSHRGNMSVIYMLSWKQCALPVMAHWLCGNSCTKLSYAPTHAQNYLKVISLCLIATSNV